MAPPICLAGIRDVDRFPLCRHFFPHWLSLLCTYTCARRFGYPQDTNDILRMPRYPQDASGILRIRYPQDTAVSSGYRVLRIPARVLGYGVPRIPPPILGICRCPQDAPRVPGRQLAFSDAYAHVYTHPQQLTREERVVCTEHAIRAGYPPLFIIDLPHARTPHSKKTISCSPSQRMHVLSRALNFCGPRQLGCLCAF